MDRKKFLVTNTTLLAGCVIVPGLPHALMEILKKADFSLETAAINKAINYKLDKLFEWMRSNGWIDYLEELSGKKLNGNINDLLPTLTGEISREKITVLRATRGFEDFAGNRLITPGFPAFSLIYHALASSRVKPTRLKDYCGLEQLDILEAAIYALSNWEKLKSYYGINPGEKLVLAVFAYEYRPSFKTPHHKYADLVFSRTGVGRIGDEPYHFDRINRCFVNKPSDISKIKHAAVIPARFGVFIARKVKNIDVSLMTTGIYKQGDLHNDSEDKNRYFLQPIRKISMEDSLIGGNRITYSETHRSEKLHSLFTRQKLEALSGIIPEIKTSEDLVIPASQTGIGSSFLAVSKPQQLIRTASAKGNIIYFKVPKDRGEDRFYNSFNTQEVEDIELLSQGARSPNEYDHPRNQALFVNVTHELPDTLKRTEYRQIQREMNSEFEKAIADGDYYSPAFEDSICDGCVMASIPSLEKAILPDVETIEILPAFSVITAPDFFPLVDNFDLIDYDIAPGNARTSNFYEGGIASLAIARLSPNPKSIPASGDPTIDTYTSVMSALPSKDSYICPPHLSNLPDDKTYYSSGFLPDASSSVFAPGWDITYAGENDRLFLSTEGLGSPFIEDMKLCSAMNGMWPAASPDASRTYQGSLQKQYRNPTAIPLLDEELGFHGRSQESPLSATFGWDGEQGPFIEKIKQKWKVNFTDLARADCVQNALDDRLDFSKLREITSAELIQRMACLKLCIERLPKVDFRSGEEGTLSTGYTYHWLVSAEKVNWGIENANAWGIPPTLVGSNKEWITLKENAKVKGLGYLFVFVDTVKDQLKKREWADYKRRRLDCQRIYICEVTSENIVYGKIIGNSIDWQP
ncbi:hypothetical protein [Pinibacter aurantiacus]|uniref:Uncharacterized protein n=1 Tax=Pinibacter aurantiacus TaxID=2851599 RepID=A0A9E2SE84_9BACT|nr:hypothetical protein [Pinibacter aurantiacus]MBV4360492.1 hypothetical protein [Pinibacter aurantiacus]